MSNNNYAGFSYGGAQYTAPGAAAASYTAAAVGQAAYPAVTNATYAANAAYQTAAAAGGYAAVGATNAAAYGYDYSRPMQTYDATKTYYQQAPTNYNTAPSTGVGKTHYSAPPVKNINQGNKAGGAKDKVNGAGKQPQQSAATVAAPAGYASYDAALYSAASLYVAQQQQQQAGSAAVANHGKQQSGAGSGGNWSQYKGGRHSGGAGGGGGAAGGSGGNNANNRGRSKPPPRPQQLHYCEVCKISCAGPQTYREHLEGQKHKKREASLKLQSSAQAASQNRGNNYHCDLCDVTCTGTDAYAAHVRGSKHQKVVKLHQKLGKPIPPDEPKKMSKINFVPASATSGATLSTVKVDGSAAAESTNDNEVEDMEQDDMVAGENTDNIKPVGGEYIDEIKDDEGKMLSFNCKLCDCKFNDPNAKEMHMKGRRHRLQYKRKVQPDLVVDFKPTPRQRRLAEARAQRALMQSHRGNGGVGGGFNDEQDGGGMYWDEQRRRAQYDDEYDYSNWLSRSFAGPQRGFGGRGAAGGPPPFFGMMPGGAGARRPESTDDRHAIARHAEIYPKEEELQTIQRIVSHTERALKFVSDSLADKPADNGTQIKLEKPDAASIKDGRDNQMFSFQKDADTGNVRVLKGVMRVGFLAKGLLLQGDTTVELVVLCAEKPTVGLLKRVATELPNKLKEVAGEQSPVDYKVEMSLEDSAIIVSDDCVTVRITLTSPLLRETADAAKQDAANVGTAALLPREPCLQALAELRHAKWFQARATGLQSCVMVIRILRDLCHRVASWQALPQWSLELLVEKVISSAGFPLSPGDCMRRIMEALSTGFIINGPGLLDPCEKEAQDALQGLSKQQREDLTVAAQQFLRFIAFRQIFKVLGMEQLPALKYPTRPWRLNRKRRRSSGKSGQPGDDKADADDKVTDEKVAKLDKSA